MLIIIHAKQLLWNWYLCCFYFFMLPLSIAKLNLSICFLQTLKFNISTLHRSFQEMFQLSFEVCMIMNSFLTRALYYAGSLLSDVFSLSPIKAFILNLTLLSASMSCCTVLLCILRWRLWAFESLRLETFPFILADYSDSILNYVSLRSGTEFLMYSLFSNGKAEEMFCFSGKQMLLECRDHFFWKSSIGMWIANVTNICNHCISETY